MTRRGTWGTDSVWHRWLNVGPGIGFASIATAPASFPPLPHAVLSRRLRGWLRLALAESLGPARIRRG